jgi:hypothetical protein
MTHLGGVAFDEFPVSGALRRTFLAVPASDFRDMHEHQRQCCRHRQRCGSRHFDRSVRCPQPDVCDLVASALCRRRTAMRRHRRIAISLLAGTLKTAAAFSLAAASSGASTVPSRTALAATWKMLQTIGSGCGFSAMPAVSADTYVGSIRLKPPAPLWSDAR